MVTLSGQINNKVVVKDSVIRQNSTAILHFAKCLLHYDVCADTSCSSVYVSVCLSVYHKLVFYRNGWTDLASFGAPRLPSTYSSRYCNEIQVSTKIRTVISRLELCLKLWTQKISPRHINRRNVLAT